MQQLQPDKLQECSTAMHLGAGLLPVAAAGPGGEGLPDQALSPAPPASPPP